MDSPAAFTASAATAPAAPMAWPRHLRDNFRLALPVFVSQLGHITVTIADSMFVGRLGKVPLAGIGVVNNTFVMVLVIGLGISMGITPLVAQAAARGKQHRLALLLGSGLTMCLGSGILLAALGWGITWVLPYLNQPPEVVILASPFLRLLGLSMIPLMLFQALRQFAEGMAFTVQAMVISLAANLINVLLNYALIFGHFGAPQLGMIGSAWATLIARVIMAGMMAVWFWRAPRFAPYRSRLASRFRHIRRILNLGVPITGQMLLETGAFAFSGLMMGWIGTTALAAHQISLNVASFTYMGASGIGAAATIRVGQFSGAGESQELRRAASSAIGMAFIFMLVMGLAIVLARHQLPLFYEGQVPSLEVRALAAQLLIIAALFQVSDGVQVTALGVLRGLHDVRIPGLISLIAYWVIALPLGYWLAFPLHMGAPGLWAGLLLGLTLSAGALSWRVWQKSHHAPGN